MLLQQSEYITSKLFVVFLALCVAPMTLASNPLNFTEESIERGVDFYVGLNYQQVGAGIALADFDNDGDLDMALAGSHNGAFGLYENDGLGFFTDRTQGSGFAPMPKASGMAVADYDNDGDLDIHVPGMFVPSRLYRNNGDFTFTNVADIAGVDVLAPAMASAWGDYDQDGHLDLYATIRTFTDGDPTENKLYHNNGDGTFTDVAVQLGVEAPGDPSCLVTFFDYDRDGDDDIYVGTDKGTKDGLMLHNKLYKNMGDGTFVNATHEANAKAYIFCMGIAIGDINFDGYFDLYMTNIAQGNVLYMYDGVGAYEDYTLDAGVGSYMVGWGTVFADFDNDTYLDLYVCNMLNPNRLYRGSKAWPLIDEAPTAGVDVANTVFSVAVGDIDGDNDLDMITDNRAAGVKVFINNSSDLSQNNWVRFNVVGDQMNRYAVGTCVDISAAGKAQVREVRSGVNYKAQDEFTLHYGLADATNVDGISIAFANGESRTLINAPVNQTWSLYPPSMLGDENGNGRVDWYELEAAIDMRTGPGGVIVPGQEIYDMDGDFDIDNDDLALLGLEIVSPSVK
jgi:hypothetical protein